MNLPALCIRRPAFTIVISLVMMMIGLIGFTHLPVRWIPNVSPPEVSIMTTYPGANASLVERDITRAIEDQLSGISGIEMLTSTSRQGESQIEIRFKLGQNMDSAVEDVRSSLERIRDALPKEANNPVVLKADPNMQPLLYISFNDTNRDARALSDYLDKFIVPVFETVDGVGQVLVYGKRVSAMRIRLDPMKMAGANVTIGDVTDLLEDQNTSIPSGQIRSADRYYSVITDAALKTPEQFNNLIIRDNLNQVVRLKDIGEAKLDAENTDTAFRINGKPGIVIAIIPQSTANPLEVETRLKKTFSELKHSLPNGMRATVAFDQADYIRASIHSVYESLFEAVLFVWFVILLFLRNFRATLIPVITIPVCLVSTFSILYGMNFSINTITLMAFVLAIGLVVDDAIVMLENISRHIESGLSPFTAALKGSREMIFPVIAMTLTLAAVYTPIAFTSGLLGVLFREFTFTLAGAVIISGVVALTLSPMMCARLLKKSHGADFQKNGSGLVDRLPYVSWVTKKLALLQDYYPSLLTFLLLKRKWVLGSLLLVGCIGVVLYHFSASELAPPEDMNELFVSVAAPRDASFHYSDQYAKKLETVYSKIPDVESYLSIVGTHSASHSFQILILKPKNQRQQSISQLIASINQEAAMLSGVRVNVFSPPPALAEFASGDEGESMGLAILTSNDYQHLQQSSQRLLDEIKKVPGFMFASNELKWDSEQFQLNIDREKVADLKLEMADIVDTISTLIAGRVIGKADDADVMVQMNESALADPNIFQSLYVRNTKGEMISLGNVVNLSESSSPDKFSHYERMRSDTISLNLAPNFKIADAIKALEKIAKDNLPDDIRYTFTGEAKSFLESSGKTIMTFLLAFIFIYLVLVAQFESFIDPFIILLSVPFALVGAIFTLKIFGGSLNIYSNIGLITLVGLIAKHGILITDFANRLRIAGLSIHDAVIQAASLRLRPILMTTAAMVLGALPLALASGPGAESRQQIGLVIAGGLFFGTFFSLIVVPIVYTYLSPLRRTLAPSSEEKDYATVL